MTDKDETTGKTESLQARRVGPPGCVLRVLEGSDAGAVHELTAGAAVIGSDPGADFLLSDSSVSRRHLQVEVAPEGLVVTDLESTNGTFYLETRIAKAVVPVGAVLRLGRTRLLLASPQLPASQDYSGESCYGALVGGAPAMRKLYATLQRIESFSDYTVLLTGESGVGKELVASEIHKHSKRAAGPFEVCDCASLPPTLAESQLFGHVKGAFTGAQNNFRGVFERAHGGTIFLDEIGELPLELQPKLLRVLQGRTVLPLGATTHREVDVRVIAATNRDLAAECRAGRFREDLYFRLKMIAVTVPSLRERREDIPELVRAFVAELAPDQGELSAATMELFTTGYDWPGNVRELRHAIASTLAMGAPPSELEQVSREPGAAPASDAPFQEAKRRIVDAFERDYLTSRMAKSGGNISQAARGSGVERNYFKQLLRKHDLLPERSED